MVLESELDGLARFLHVPVEWAAALSAAAAGLLLAGLVRFVVRPILLRVASRTTTELDDALIRALAAPVAFTFLIGGVGAGVRILLPEPHWTLPIAGTVATALIIVWSVGVARLLVLLFQRAARRLHGPADATHVVPFMSRMIKLLVVLVALILVLFAWDVEITPLLAGAGILGIALALAAQDTLANFFAGIAIYLDRPYKIGDTIIVEGGGKTELRGQVYDVGLRSTRIVTRDDVLVTVPNSVMASSRLVNETAPYPRYRIRVPVSVAYEEDMDRVERVLASVASGHPKVRTEPAPIARIQQFAASGVDWNLLVWIEDPMDKGPVTHDLSLAIHRTFRKEGIRIPFPQMDVHMIPPER